MLISNPNPKVKVIVMKFMSASLKHLIYILIVLLSATTILQAQAPASHTRRFISPDPNINGFYEYLPRGYTLENPKKYPLIIFFHGVGESGSVQNNATLDLVMAWGPPQLIDNKIQNRAAPKVQFPDSFRVGGTGAWYKFIVLSPQIKAGLDWTTVTDTIKPSTVDAMVEYAKANYRVDLTRIYLCGLSMGGGAVWDYAGSSTTASRKIAAMAIACGAGDLTTTEANNIASPKIPVLCTHNKGDATVTWTRTNANVAKVNAYVPSITPAPKAVFWTGGAHNVWSRTFEDINPGVTTQGLTGNLRDTLGMNVYQWLLQFTQTSLLPVTWNSFSGSIGNEKVILKWVISNQQDVAKYSVEKSGDGNVWSEIATVPAQKYMGGNEQQYTYTDPTAVQRPFFYRIKQTDLNGQYTYSSVVKIGKNNETAVQVKIFPNPFNRQISIGLSGINENDVIVRLVNNDGHTLVKQQYNLSGTDNTITLDNVKQISKGVYYITLQNKEGATLYRSQVVKQ